MRAALFQAVGKPLEIGRVPDPIRRDGDTIIQISHCGICGSDLHATEVNFLAPGAILGHEFAGIVADSGPDGPPVGTRVTALPYRPCLACEECESGQFQHCGKLVFVGLGLPGAFAEFAALPSRFLQTLPAGVGFEQGALVEPLAVAHHAVALAGPVAGADVLILGGGPIGAAVTLFVASQGARHVVVSEPSPHRRRLAASLGAASSFDPTTENLGERVVTFLGRAPDIVFECVGAPGLIGQAIEYVRHRGQVVVAGALFGQDNFLPQRALAKEVTLRFSFSYTVSDFEAVIDAIARARIAPEPMLTDRITLDELPEAFESLRKPTRQCKVLVGFN